MLRHIVDNQPATANENSPVTGRLVALIGDAPHAWTMVNALRRHFGDFPVIVEKGEPSSVFWARRRRKFGWAQVTSQKAVLLLAKASKLFSRARLRELQADCNSEPVPAESRVDVNSVNDEQTIRLLLAMSPRAIFVASTGLLRPNLLDNLTCPIVNYHSGVNPAYRGINGGYFALANSDPDHFGVTLHLVDKGVDTGDILAVNRIPVTPRDNLQTYMTLMAANSQDLVVETMERVLSGDVTPRTPNTSGSHQYYSPTLGEYLRNGLTRGVW